MNSYSPAYFWDNRAVSAGKDFNIAPEYKSPNEFWEACREYFEWSVNTPLELNVHSFSSGSVNVGSVEKPRAMSLMALCFFLGISKRTWVQWKNSRLDLSDVMDMAEDIIYTQKFELAAADILNANFIARDLGMSDKSDARLSGAGPNGEHIISSAIDVSALSLEELEVLQSALSKSMEPKAIPSGGTPS
jgi:hypothetical protein